MLRFSKNERLSNQKIIDCLFSVKTKFIVFPFSVRYLFTKEEKTGADILIIVPKRLFKRAVDRNRIKRLLRESYRLQKESFLSNLQLSNERLHFSIALISKQKLNFAQTQNCMKEILYRLTKLQSNESISNNQESY
ncbi:MAG: ribonuclease P protein component [Bacteroidales bacterium]|jgi:ribonuclease P protein component|nr:ribonuclease P protein component [Bacteroidales bacterium]